jgi:hypothetical protein
VTPPGTTSCGDEGSATVEFALFSMLMLVPFTYVLLTVFQVQRAAYGITEASRAAGRAYVTAASGADAEGRAEQALQLAMRDQGLDAQSAALHVVCSAQPCLTPGASITVVVEGQVPLPWVPSWLGRPAASVDVRAVHVETVDRYRAARP